MPEPAATHRSRTRWLAVGVVGVLLCWVMATPRNGGPDEPSHSVASAALVRGQFDGRIVDLGYPTEVFDVPSMVGDPNPACYAFTPAQPADCAGAPADTTAILERDSTSANYPVWGHLLPGLASFVPWPAGYAYLARGANAALAALLVLFALRRLAPRPLHAAALLVGLTPIAWFSMSIVSPSALAIAGGAALWAALLQRTERSPDLLLLAGWLALLLPRRDGPLFATLIVLTVCVATRELPGAVRDRLGRHGLWVVLTTAPLPVVPWVLQPSGPLNLLLAVSPLALLAVEFAGRALHRRPVHVATAGLLGLWATGLGLAVVGAGVLRPGGTDTDLLFRLVDTTGEHLFQLVGRLGWLDTPVPQVAVFGWWLLVGSIGALSLLAGARAAAVAGLALVTMVVLAWVLELGTGDTSGTYWQGRYSMPFIVGLVLLAASGAAPSGDAGRRVVTLVTAGCWLVWNLAFAEAMRRWAVGTAGSLLPWRWETGASPGPTTGWLLLHATASAALCLAVRGHREPVAPAAPADGTR